jgi:hypothetical protein
LALSCAGGGAVIAVLQLVLGNRALDHEALLGGGFMLGTVGSLVAMVYGIRRWKARAQGVPFAGGTVHAPSAPLAAVSSKKELLIAAACLAGLGAFLAYDFGQWEATGGRRSMSVILYGLYMLLGRWGVAALCWIGAVLLAWKGLPKQA